MSKFTSIFLLAISLKGYPQKPVSYYKKLADNFMARQINSAVLKKVVCMSYLAKSQNDDRKRYSGEWSAHQKDTVNGLEWIGFFYDYYSPKLNYTFHWYLTFNEEEKIGPEWMLTKTIPNCIRLNIKCTLLSKDEAVKIAIKDSLPYPDNYYVEFVRPKHSSEFYWAITSVDKRQVDYSIKPTNGLDLPIPPWKKRNTRLIHAVTGKLIPLQEYYSLDKE